MIIHDLCFTEPSSASYNFTRRSAYPRTACRKMILASCQTNWCVGPAHRLAGAATLHRGCPRSWRTTNLSALFATSRMTLLALMWRLASFRITTAAFRTNRAAPHQFSNILRCTSCGVPHMNFDNQPCILASNRSKLSKLYLASGSIPAQLFGMYCV